MYWLCVSCKGALREQCSIAQKQLSLVAKQLVIDST